LFSSFVTSSFSSRLIERERDPWSVLFCMWREVFWFGFFAEHGIVFFLHHVVLLGLSFFSESELYLISVLDGFLRGFCFFCLTASCAVSLCLSDFVCTPEMSSFLFP
jgi:hypothetical protein